MNSHEFHELTHYVMDSPASPPASLFAGGFDDWRSRQLNYKLPDASAWHSTPNNRKK